MKEFRINEYLSLKLEEGETVIYVANQAFMTCKYLLLNIESKNIKKYDEISSIDEAIEFYSSEHERDKSLLEPETEFWGHCSNLQAWTDHYYDTRLLDMNLAFPLLKELSDAGDPIARKVFKEEIAKRIASGFPNVITFILEEKYIESFTVEERDFIFKLIDPLQFSKGEFKKTFPLLKILAKLGDFRAKDIFKKKLMKEMKSMNHNVINYILQEQYVEIFSNEEKKEIFDKINHEEILNLEFWQALLLLHKLSNADDLIAQKMFREMGKIEEIMPFIDPFIDWNKSQYLPSAITTLSNLKKLDLSANSLKEVPPLVYKIETLKLLLLNENQITSLSPSLGNLKNLKRLKIKNNNLNSLPREITNLENLRELRVCNNSLTNLPEHLGKLASLKALDLNNNEILTLPPSIKNLKALEFLDISNNHLSVLPEFIGNLTSLKILYLHHNNLTTLPNSFSELSSLEYLFLFDNELTYLPEEMGELSSLKILHLDNNQIERLPHSLRKLQSLEKLYLRNNNLRVLPDWIGSISCLKKIYIDNNKLSTLPNTLCNIKFLEELSVKGNCLESIPDCLIEKNSLILLNLTCNKITESKEDFVNINIFDNF
ncbi:MAG: hypothetical protein BAJALOKI1v1_1690005 [Promethearchaeota archaeon]|nr:MAG: hypothetical protein BAJALOKI1v1_1690005 [Candidatus Lokiarchaeota archaeon]